MADMKRVSWRSMCGDCPSGSSSIMHNEDHPGFAAVQGKIEKEGYSKGAAGAILANASRHASKAAKKANPNLKKVK